MRRTRMGSYYYILPVAIVDLFFLRAAADEFAYSGTHDSAIVHTSGFQRECQGYDEEWGVCPDLPGCNDGTGGKCVPKDCVFDTWEDWHSEGGCSGLIFRRRGVHDHNNECGKPCEGPRVMSQRQWKEEGQDSQTCEEDSTDCKFSDWSPWSNCRDRLDQAVRSRSVESPPGIGGNPCNGPLRETKACSGIAPTPCQWSEWNSWQRCSVTCGTGRHERMRRVQTKASPGGQPCYGVSLQNAPCDAGPCPKVDCRLGDWSVWSECDVGAPQRFRKRSVLVAPSNGGQACSEYLMETVSCYAAKDAGEDCEIGLWSSWTDCSRTCGGGQKYRQRQLVHPNTEGGFCHDAVLHQAQSCGMHSCINPAPNDCVFAQWDQWSHCNAQCGKGTRIRRRKIAVQAINGGQGCEGPTNELSPCQMHTCLTVDCKWSDWEDWSACTATCAGGTKRRERNVAEAPQHGGKQCDPLEKAEMTPCNTMSCDAACTPGEWASWSAWTECSATCDAAYKSRRRDVAVQPSSCGKPAVGLREEFQKCIDLPPCQVDQDCQMGEWGDWSMCSCKCFGISERNRAIAQFAKGKGLSCNGTVKEIIPCNPLEGEVAKPECGQTKRKTDCHMSAWTDWTECTATCGNGHRGRKREITVPAAHGGTPCAAELAEVRPCGNETCPTSSCHDCVWGEWGQWGVCSKCGGQRFRYRAITQLPNHCGKQCEPHDAKEAGGCFSKCEKKLFCTWTEWSKSESCDKCGAASQTRNRALGMRHITDDYLFQALESGEHTSCAGTQLNVSVCPENPECQGCKPVHCEFAPWSEWDDPTCLGLCERHRNIGQHNNECGIGCDGATTETKVCPVVCQPKQDCELGQWADWSGCDDTLGKTSSMQMSRIRDIVKMPMNGGEPCEGNLEQTKPCPIVPQDCELSPWSQWTVCSTKCIMGWHTRSRTVQRESRHGGTACDGDVVMVEPCQGTDPSCSQSGKQDCAWKTWAEWARCDEHGQTTRTRQIEKLPSILGEPCVGGFSETSSCDSTRVDCDVSPWSGWDDCDKTCDGGQTHRHREIHRYPSAGGSPCPTILMETRGCNTQSCSGHDCMVSEWGDWGFCSTTCGLGQTTRSREITSLRGIDGHGCYNVLGQVKACKNERDCERKDCVWGDWTQWSLCSRRCEGGMRSRKRHIQQVPSRDGKQCEAEIKEQLQPCNTHSCSLDHSCKDGQWAQWSDWAHCSVTCSRGTTYRMRHVAQGASDCGRPPQGLSTETRICEVSVPCMPDRDCEFNDWGGWGTCSASCDGVSERSRTVKHYGLAHGKYCQGAMKQLRPCNPFDGSRPPPGCQSSDPIDCKMGAWSLWTRCTAACDGGVQRRQRTVEQRAFHGGRGCLAALSEVQECNRHTCDGSQMPINCQLGQWEEWGPCNKCGGEKTRFRNILRYAANGGTPCPLQSVREVDKCPRDCSNDLFCVWQTWQEWGSCTKTCGRGAKRRRRRYLHLSHDAAGDISPGPGSGAMPPGPEGEHGGYPTVMDSKSQEDRDQGEFIQQSEAGQYKIMYDRAQTLETDQMKELLFAFSGGFLSLFALLFAGRAWALLSSTRDGGDLMPVDAIVEERTTHGGDHDVTPLIAP